MSYVFYGWWDVKFLSLLILSTLIDFFVGISYAHFKNRKILLGISIVSNLGILGFFKYFNFFIDGFSSAFSFLGFNFGVSSLDIILPVGISFYTFQTLSYAIDVYKGKISPTRDFVAFSAYVSFFPQLVAGPIERATTFLPQFFKSRIFSSDDAKLGLKQIFWGLFKKIVIADNCAIFADLIFENPEHFSGGMIFIGAAFFAFQIYGDFSGYSDIAIGTAKLFGFTLMKNFAFPYFSRDIAEFWRRWHISLTTWFRDYIYIPLGGSRINKKIAIRNTFIVFLISGFWHGANWTFLAWGFLNAVLFLPLLVLVKNRNHIEIVAKGKSIPSLLDIFKIIYTFCLVSLLWIFFRAKDIHSAILMVKKIFSYSFLELGFMEQRGLMLITIGLVVFFVLIEWIGRESDFAIETIGRKKPKFLRWSFYGFLFFMMAMYMHTEETPFIYFQF